MIRWDAPGPYEVVFSTRVGGVSEGPYESLNLGRLTGDVVERVDENRRRLCAEIGHDAERLALNRQVHSTLVHRAVAGARGEPGDGLWTDEPDLPVLAMTADCLPSRSSARTARSPPSRCCTSAGAASSAGIVAVGVERSGRAQACIGPAIGPCCYEVGPRRGGAVRRRASEPTSCAVASWICRRPPSERSGPRAVAAVERIDLCTSCHPELFFSHRRDRQAARRAGRDRACRLRPSAPPTTSLRDEVGERHRCRRDEVRVARGHGGAGRGRRRGRRREPRSGSGAQARRVRRRVPLALHRPPPVPNKAKIVNRLCELVHSLDSDSAARRLTVPALVEINLVGRGVEVRDRARAAGRLPRGSPGARA